jgi:hypothetical protein
MFAQFPSECDPLEISKTQADSIINPIEYIRQTRITAALDSPWINPEYLPDELYHDRDNDLIETIYLPAENREESGLDSLGRAEYRTYYRVGEPVLVEKIGYGENPRAFMAYRPEKSRWWKCAE